MRDSSLSAGLITARGLEDYFFEKVRGAFFNQNFQASPHAEFYLVRLLSDYCSYSIVSKKNPTHETPISIQYLNLLQTSVEKRFRALKNLADFILYMTGFFQDNLTRKTMDLKFYISLGGDAYQKLHGLGPQVRFPNALGEIFSELAKNFIRFVDILSEVSENSKICKNSDLLKVYENWLTTGSKLSLKKLNQFGIYPNTLSSSIIKH